AGMPQRAREIDREERPISIEHSLFRRLRATAVAATVVASLLVPTASSSAADPTSVTIAGSLQSEIGCPGDWDPGCAASHLAYDPTDDVWQGTFNVPAGSYEYKAALNDAWDESYGLNGGNIPLNLASDGDVKFYYD